METIATDSRDNLGDRPARGTALIAGACATVALVGLVAGCSDKTPLRSDAGAAPEGGTEAGPGAAACRADSDCAVSTGVFWCANPYEPIHCGPVLSQTPGQPCGDDADCTGSEICRVPVGGVDAGGLACSVDRSCVDDADCGPNRVCREDPTVPTAWISANGLACARPCATSSDCPPTSMCDSNGHCRARACAECPSYFSCSSGVCSIPTCSADTQCTGGYCVRGTCAGSLGTCRMVCL
jgi:hypothetical protein